MDAFNVRLLQVMKEAGVTQNELALAAKTSARLIRYYLSAEKMPNIENLFLISKYLGVSTDYLLGLSDDPRRVEDIIPDEHAAGAEPSE